MDPTFDTYRLFAAGFVLSSTLPSCTSSSMNTYSMLGGLGIKKNKIKKTQYWACTEYSWKNF